MGSLKVIIFQYARDIWCRRWYAVGVAWAICLVGWVVVSRMPDIYESSARVYMNSDEALTPLLRGVYFTSGTQEGTPIDRLTGVMARAFGLDQRRAAALRPQQGRSYFLGRLVSQVILGEAMLVSEPPAARARRIAIRAASYAAVGLATLGIAGWLVMLGILGIALRSINHAMRRGRDPYLRSLLCAIFASGVGFLITMIGVNVFFQIALQVFFWGLIGLGLGLSARVVGTGGRLVTVWRFGDERPRPLRRRDREGLSAEPVVAERAQGD